MRFFVGLHQPSDARHFGACMVSVNRLRKRRSGFLVDEWLMDSGAFTELHRFGCFRHDAAHYAAEIRRWRGNGRLLAAAAQDWICAPQVVARTGLTVERHQALTVERFDQLVAADPGVEVLPVLQGFDAADYVRHVGMYGERLAPGAWVGVGSVQGRSRSADAVGAVLLAIKTARPDLRLHGFGLKTATLADAFVRSLLHSADSMAWSFHARRNGRSGNDWREARRWLDVIETAPRQTLFDF